MYVALNHIYIFIFQYYLRDPHNEDQRKLLDLIKRMLHYEPHERISLKEALHHPFFDKLNSETENESRDSESR